MNLGQPHPSSFRDPSGHVYAKNGILKRVINPIYFNQYEALKSSGFYDYLIENQILVAHKELSKTEEQIVLESEYIPFVTYPYEWSFNMYKEAALLTLKLQKLALNQGFTLKDATAFNVTFHKGKAVFIDTLSFDFYEENTPWRAYKQFVMHFLGPLLLAKYHGSHSLGFLKQFIDGIPLNIISSMLPFHSRLNPTVLTNIHLLAKAETKFNEESRSKSAQARLTKKGLLNIVENLYEFIKKLRLKESTEWGNYYDKTNYSNSGFNHKTELINTWISKLKPETLIDIGGNDGTFVRKLNFKPRQSLVCDVDYKAVDANYVQMKLNKEKSVLPMLLDVLQPSPSIGFNNKERASFIERITSFKPKVTMALALVHHMSISGNIPFSMSAEFFASFSKFLIIEFPTRQDSYVQRLLSSKMDFESYFDFYNREYFEKSYLVLFDIIEQIPIEDSNRIMYFLKRK